MGPICGPRVLLQWCGIAAASKELNFCWVGLLLIFIRTNSFVHDRETVFSLPNFGWREEEGSGKREEREGEWEKREEMEGGKKEVILDAARRSPEKMRSWEEWWQEEEDKIMKKEEVKKQNPRPQMFKTVADIKPKGHFWVFEKKGKKSSEIIHSGHFFLNW